jgi:hypothetical protein
VLTPSKQACTLFTIVAKGRVTKKAEQYSKQARAIRRKLSVVLNADVPSFGRIASGTGLHRSYVCLIFNGKRRPSSPALSRLSAFLGVSMGKLYAVLVGKAA